MASAAEEAMTSKALVRCSVEVNWRQDRFSRGEPSVAGPRRRRIRRLRYPPSARFSICFFVYRIFVL